VYFLVAVRLGEIQCHEFVPEMQHSYYKRLELCLRHSPAEASLEAILAHLLLAVFCKVCLLNDGFIKHTSSAKALLDILDLNVSQQVKKAFDFVANGIMLPSISKCGMEFQLLEIFMCQASLAPDFFRVRFPFLAKLMSQSTLIDTSEGFRTALLGMFQGSPLFFIPLVTAPFFHKIFRDSQVSKTSMKEQLLEVRAFVALILKSMKLTMETVPPMTLLYIFQLDSFLLLVDGDFEGCKMLLDSILQRMDFWTLQTGYFFWGEVLIHQLHFVLAATVLLHMEEGYVKFLRKLNLVFSLSQHPLTLKTSMSDFVSEEHQSLCKCQKMSAECNIMVIVNSLAIMCARDFVGNAEI